MALFKIMSKKLFSLPAAERANSFGKIFDAVKKELTFEPDKEAKSDLQEIFDKIFKGEVVKAIKDK